MKLCCGLMDGQLWDASLQPSSEGAAEGGLVVMLSNEEVLSPTDADFGEFTIAEATEDERHTLKVPDFSDHDDVGILPQHAPEPRGERKVYRGIYLYLVNPPDPVFHRIFYRHDIHSRLVHKAHDRIERCRLSGTRRSGNKEHAVRTPQDFFYRRQVFSKKAKFLKLECGNRFMENPHDCLFTVDGRNCRYPERHFVSASRYEAELAVLGKTLFVKFKFR